MHENKTHNQVIIPIEIKQQNDLERQIEELNIQLTRERRMRQHLEEELSAERQRAKTEIRHAYNSLEKRATELAAKQLQKYLEELEAAQENLLVQNEELIFTRKVSEAQYQRYLDLFNFAPDGYLVTDTTGKIEEANQAAAALLFPGKDSNCLVGKPFFTFIPSQEYKTFSAKLEQLTTELHYPTFLQPSHNWEMNLKPNRGKVFPATITVRAILDSQGKTGSLCWLIRDITERKRAEENRRTLVREQEGSLMRLRFFSMASHELRTPLSTILVTIQLLLSFSHQLSDEQRIRKFSQIERASKRMTQIINDLLTISRTESGKIELWVQPLNLKQFCSDLLEEIKLNASSNYTINFTIKGDYNQVCFDKNNLNSILVNLLSNAVKYSPQGGEVSLEVTCTSGKASFRIRDQGIGISNSDQSHVFEAFYRGGNIENIAGSGLGLTVVKKCVELHGGRINLESAIGVGTTFTVMIPYS
ncbi:MAG: PAS domain S-box protein [Symploca sp. SIO1C4]|uniref:histidine kinase n=1 Tax=Symploca sp. SIO1C4 TaxID=2607765 RepID=A0A6B3NN06_9CYAN|nr:PAS domain S-box protein [Symploca sp. SIO1C4]